LEPSRVAQLQLSGEHRYPDEVVAHLQLVGDDAKRAGRKLRDNVSLAKLVSDEWADGAEVPAYVDRLLDLVHRSRRVA